ncbi:hypothetical protein [Candidatus Cetobacterium colombiensis]|uniref:Uncharacterized protein n=1 Tax=Candidatus Cetobacterium colombiensis TaxID=3073100 RepID=A0ABU4WD44_9FUSO|nr:hypothetical protein [Candidatus Cetobacterium colombiensis]MDX8337456.1 hypothetical protein [Candidatus Cetobacterium colombiensis]
MSTNDRAIHFFHKNLAIEIGVDEAIFLQNIYYLCKSNLLNEKLDTNSKISATLSRKKILEYQSYFSYTAVRRITQKLINLNLMEVTQDSVSTNSLSYVLTLKGWITMLFLEKNSELKKIEMASAKFSNTHLSYFINQLLISAKDVSNLADVLLKSTEVVSKSADIYINNINLIERNIKIEKIADENSENILDEIDSIILKNSILKKRIEKSFENTKNYKNKIIVPAIEKYGISKVIKALRNTSEQFLPHSSPVGNFYLNLNKLIIV